MRKNPILVTGIHRSGSTFVGKMLTLDKKVAYIQEPFNKGAGLEIIDVWFKYLNKDNISNKYDKSVQNLLNLGENKYKLKSLLEKDYDRLINRKDIIKEMMSSISVENFIRGVAKLVFKSKEQFLYRKAQLNPFVKRVLLKDPIACLSSQFLHRNFNMDVVLLIRHPLSFVGSLKRLGWKFNFDNFLQQSDLMNDYLKEYEAEIEEFSKRDTSIVEDGTLLWLCIYKVLFSYVDNNKQFVVIKHEDICKTPIKEFKKIYSKLDISFTERIQKRILKHTSEKNNVKVKNNQPHYNLKRDSSKLIKSWKKRLNKKEIMYIKDKTYNLGQKYYSDDTWE